MLQFDNSKYSIEFEILPCPIDDISNSYILQDIENINLKSWYIYIFLIYNNIFYELFKILNAFLKLLNITVIFQYVKNHVTKENA